LATHRESRNHGSPDLQVIQEGEQVASKDLQRRLLTCPNRCAVAAQVRRDHAPA
jgi:hypothetical protein